MMIKTLDNPFYYLDNFQLVIAWIAERYRDLLDDEECRFIDEFPKLPQAARALLVRMVMRKGSLFRASKLQYPEIGSTTEAVRGLVEAGWVDDCPALSVEQVCHLLTKAEITSAFGNALTGAGTRKAEQLETLREALPGLHSYQTWYAQSTDCVYALRINTMCERLKLMFFGNCHQDWSEFVLSELGILKYEKVSFSAASRGFRTRAEMDHYLHLHTCRERLEQGEPAEQVLPLVAQRGPDNPWLEGRRQKLLFVLGQQLERAGNLEWAHAVYADCRYPGSRLRAIRVLEKSAQPDAAYTLAVNGWNQPESEAERQQLLRMLPRLQRKLALPKTQWSAPSAAIPVKVYTLVLDRQDPGLPVELAVRDHLAGDGQFVHYVENTLINSLFGLLCWRAIFAAVPGAFFHPFHTGPADLYSPDFFRLREQEFVACLSQLESGQYRETIDRHFAEKEGIQSPFVFWGALTPELKDLALDCIPATHLRKWFERILLDIRANRAGLPDLIRFQPKASVDARYDMIEVKGPGDRLQDNQVRWIDYFATHQMPVSVCHVQWSQDT